MTLLEYAKKHKMKDYEKSFKAMKNIKEDSQVTNGNSNQNYSISEKQPQNNEENVRIFKCDICNFSTKYNFNLVAHYKTIKHITNSRSEEGFNDKNQVTNESNTETFNESQTNANGSRKRQASSSM